jgi:anti-anti-sigma factor
MSRPSHPGDRCPYPRPFPEDFRYCRAYQAVSFVAADSWDNKLGSWRTCQHLTSGSSVDEPGRFYPRCSLGNAEQRLRWLAKVTPSALEVVRALQDEFDRLSLPHREKLVEARARHRRNGGTIDPDLEELVSDFLEMIDRFLRENDERLTDVGLATAPLGELIKEWVRLWARTPQFAETETPADPSDRLDGTRRAFVGLAPPRLPVAIPRLMDAPIYQDSILQIVPTVDPPGLALIGDIDASNTAALSQALSAMAGSADDLHLDLTEVFFCDVGGLQTIVGASQALPSGKRLILHGVPQQVQSALDLMRWAMLPTIAIEESRAR